MAIPRRRTLGTRLVACSLGAARSTVDVACADGSEPGVGVGAPVLGEVR